LKLKEPSIPEVTEYVIETGSDVNTRTKPYLGLFYGSKTLP